MKKSFKLGMLTTLSVASIQLATIKEAVAHALGGEWLPRSVEDVKASLTFEDENGNIVYEIQYGDTLGTIAQAFDLSVQEIATLNRIDNPDLIYAGASLTFNEEAHTLTFTSSDGEEEVTYSTQDGRQVVETPVEEEVATPEVEYLLTPVEEVEVDLPFVLLEEEEEVEEVEEDVEVEASLEQLAASLSTLPVERPVLEDNSFFEVLPEVEEIEAVEEVEEDLQEEVEEAVLEEETTVEEEIVAEEEPQEVTNSSSSTSFGPDQAQEAFQAIVKNYGVSAEDAEKWSTLIGYESGWNTLNYNSQGSGAYGLPQALPGNKMASHGADWETNPYTQLAWMYDYMLGRYGSISGALDHFYTNNWY